MGGSSSHKRRRQKGRRGGGHHGSRKQGSASAEPQTHRVLNFENHAITAGIGFNLMSRLGWTSGQPLGIRHDASNCAPGAGAGPDASDARAEPIPVVMHVGRAGLGARPVVIEGAEESPSSFPKPSAQTLPSSLASCATEDGEFASRAAAMAIFDPLRPRCRYDPSHVVASLKALHKHEKKCRANPNRVSAKNGPAAYAAVGSVEEWLMNSAAHDEVGDEGGSVLSDEDSILSSVLSAFSSSSLSDLADI